MEVVSSNLTGGPNNLIRGISSAGRALALQARGQEFDSLILHAPIAQLDRATDF